MRQEGRRRRDDFMDFLKTDRRLYEEISRQVYGKRRTQRIHIRHSIDWSGVGVKMAAASLIFITCVFWGGIAYLIYWTGWGR